jgi:hypothetical protein
MFIAYLSTEQEEQMRLLFSSLSLIGQFVIGTLVPQAANGRHQREVTIVMLPRI